MKKIYFSLVVALMAILSFSCSSDDDNNSNNSSNNILTIDGEEFDLKAGIIEEYGASFEDNSFNFDITLVDSNLSLNDGEYTPDNDIVTAVYFELWSESDADLSEGTYTLANTELPYTYTIGEVTIEYNTSTEDGNDLDITTGDLEVLQNGSTYEFSFEGTTDNGKDISFYYKGSLKKY